MVNVRDGVPDAGFAPADRADADATDEAVIVEQSRLEAERGRGVTLGFRDFLEDGLEDGIHAWGLGRGVWGIRRSLVKGASVDDREIKQVIGSAEQDNVAKALSTLAEMSGLTGSGGAGVSVYMAGSTIYGLDEPAVRKLQTE